MQTYWQKSSWLHLQLNEPMIFILFFSWHQWNVNRNANMSLKIFYPICNPRKNSFKHFFHWHHFVTQMPVLSDFGLCSEKVKYGMRNFQKSCKHAFPDSIQVKTEYQQLITNSEWLNICKSYQYTVNLLYHRVYDNMIWYNMWCYNSKCR